jgi:hypothetical protein
VTTATPAQEADAPRTEREGSKRATVVELITSEGGATIADIVAATGWQKHYADIGIRPTPSAAS